jgi:hypothetical protein
LVAALKPYVFLFQYGMVKTAGLLSHEIGIKGKVTSFEIPTHGLNLVCFVFEVILFGLFWLFGLLGKIKILVLIQV